MKWNHFFGIAAAVWIAPHTPPIVAISLGAICIGLQIVSFYMDGKQ